MGAGGGAGREGHCALKTFILQKVSSGNLSPLRLLACLKQLLTPVTKWTNRRAVQIASPGFCTENSEHKSAWPVWFGSSNKPGQLPEPGSSARKWVPLNSVPQLLHTGQWNDSTELAWPCRAGLQLPSPSLCTCLGTSRSLLQSAPNLLRNDTKFQKVSKCDLQQLPAVVWVVPPSTSSSASHPCLPSCVKF